MRSISLSRASVPAVVAVGALAFAAVTFAAAYTLFGDAELVQPGYNSPQALQIRSDAALPPNFGGARFEVPDGTTFADLTKLSTDFNVTDDDCAGGSPRFQVRVDTGAGLKNIFVYLGPAPNYTGCTPNTWVNSGDLLETGKTVDTSQLTGGTFYHDYDSAVAAFGTLPVTSLSVVADGSWASADGEQTILVDNVMINDDITTFDDKESCKKGGWELFAAAPGPFKNQGQCVSYFAQQQN